MLDVPVESAGGQELLDGIEQLSALANTTDAYRCAFIGELATRAGDPRDAVAGVAAQLGTTYPKAKRWVDVSLALRSLPSIAKVFATGAIDFDKAAALTVIATEETDAGLAEKAVELSLAALRRLARELKKRDDLDPERLHGERALTYRWNVDHTVLSYGGELPLELGDTFVKAIEREIDILFRSAEGRRGSYWARAADALCSIMSNQIADDADPDIATVVVHVDASLLLDGDGLAETDEGTPLDRATALRMLCDCRLQATVYDEFGFPVDIGSVERTIPRWLRRQLRKRDQGCTFPGCSNERFLRGHHIKPWPQVERTDMKNIVLLCPIHHRWVHHLGWEVNLDPTTGVVSWTRPDGTHYDPGGRSLREEFGERLFGPLIEPYPQTA